MSASLQVFPLLEKPFVQAGPVRLRETICEHTVRHCLDRCRAGLDSILLAGSMARDEAAFTRRGDLWNVLGDAEFLLIYRQGASLPPESDLRPICDEITFSLLDHRIVCPITLQPAPESYLREMQPHIFGYEMRTRGRVVWGNPNALNLIPEFQPQDIPLEDAWRLLSNRMVEQVEIAAEFVPGVVHFARPMRYHAIKLYLDMATSFLVFARAYLPTYRHRSQVLNFLVDWLPKDAPLPFPLRDFAEKVQLSTEWKVGAADWEAKSDSKFWKSAMAYAWLLWRWELAHLTQSQLWESDRVLRERWMRRQPLGARLRGWAYAARRRGWVRSWRDWPLWLSRSLRGSPRHWVYASASEMCFHLPWILETADHAFGRQLDWGEVQGWLPLVDRSARKAAQKNWQCVAKEIASNYHEFVEKTCA